MRDTLPSKIRKHERGIINMDSVKNAGTHWSAYIKNNDIVNYFDSFGNLKPPREVIKYFKPSAKIVYYNRDRYQDYNTSNCGQLCLKFLQNDFKNFNI